MRWSLASLLSEYRLELAWLVFAVANLAIMEGMIRQGYMPGWQTVPFHFVYLSFTILYGFRAWRAGRAALGMLFVTGSTGLLTLQAVGDNKEGLAELTEVPLMTLMFAAMVFHVIRRQQAMATAQRLAVERQQLLDREHAFVSDASHELRTPLTIGRGHLELLRRQPDLSSAAVVSTCDVVLAELSRMERLVDRLLLLESSFSPDFLRPAMSGVEEFVTDLFRRWRSAADRCWTCSVDVAGSLPIDRDQLTLAIDGVLENAVSHTDPGDAIDLRATLEDTTVVIRIRDGGAGIAHDVLPHVFDRFYRGDRDRNRRTGGAGLGLAVTRAVVEAHGGSITATSTPGAGAAFEIRLPGLVGHVQPVAGAAHGLDGDERVELAAQTADAHVDHV